MSDHVPSGAAPRARHYLVTYSQAPSGIREDIYNFILSKARCGQLPELTRMVVGQENHQDGGTHYHASLTFSARYRFYDMSLLDYSCGITSQTYHPNIAPFRQGSRGNFDDYATKEDEDFLFFDSTGITRGGYLAERTARQNKSSSFQASVLASGKITTSLVIANPTKLHLLPKIREGLRCFKEMQRDEECGPRIKRRRDISTFRLWQRDLMNILAEEPNDRTIHWYSDVEGGCGKTRMALYLRAHHNAYVSDGSAMRDAFHCYAGERIVIFDLPRAFEFTPALYQQMEILKNGFFIKQKYESHPIDFEPPHVVVFANQPPPPDTFSRDRLRHWPLTREGIENTPVSADSSTQESTAAEQPTSSRSSETGTVPPTAPGFHMTPSMTRTSNLALQKNSELSKLLSQIPEHDPGLAAAQYGPTEHDISDADIADDEYETDSEPDMARNPLMDLEAQLD